MATLYFYIATNQLLFCANLVVTNTFNVHLYIYMQPRPQGSPPFLKGKALGTTLVYTIRNAGASKRPVLPHMSILSFCRHRTRRPFARNDKFSDQMKVLFLEQLYKKHSYIHNELTDKLCILFVVILVSSHLEPSTHYFDLS